jgi:hypothetical protein
MSIFDLLFDRESSARPWRVHAVSDALKHQPELSSSNIGHNVLDPFWPVAPNATMWVRAWIVVFLCFHSFTD